jgi:hypothetical protein
VAATRVSPDDWCLPASRKTDTPGSVLNLRAASFDACVLPFSCVYPTPWSRSACSTICSPRSHCTRGRQTATGIAQGSVPKAFSGRATCLREDDALCLGLRVAQVQNKPDNGIDLGAVRALQLAAGVQEVRQPAARQGSDKVLTGPGIHYIASEGTEKPAGGSGHTLRGWRRRSVCAPARQGPGRRPRAQSRRRPSGRGPQPSCKAGTAGVGRPTASRRPRKTYAGASRQCGGAWGKRQGATGSRVRKSTDNGRSGRA